MSVQTKLEQPLDMVWTTSRLLLETEGRLISIDIKYFTLINIGAPSGTLVKDERNNFLRQTVPTYTINTRLPFVLIGDFNYVDDIQDKSKTQSLPVKPNVINDAVKEMVTGLDLVFI